MSTFLEHFTEICCPKQTIITKDSTTTLQEESITQRLTNKKKWLQETLVSTATTPQRKAVVPSKEVILALEKGVAAAGADPQQTSQQARAAIDSFIMGMVRFQVGSSARFNDLQHTSPGTLRITSNTVEMMAWQTKTASAFRIKKNPVPLIAPKLSLSGVDWWSDWVKTLQLLYGTKRFSEMDYLIPTLSKDFQGVIPRPGTSDRSLRWLKEALIRQGVEQELVAPLTWHSFPVFIPDCAYQLGIPRATKAVLGKLADGVHGGHLYPGEAQCGGGYLVKSDGQDPGGRHAAGAASS